MEDLKEVDFLPGTRELRYEYIVTPEQIEKLKAFALEFDHRITTLKYPYVAFKVAGQWIGYAQLVDDPIVFPAFHPGKATKRMVIEVMRNFVGQAKLRQPTQNGFVGVPLNTLTFVPHIMSKMGFEDTNNKLYIVGGD